MRQTAFAIAGLLFLTSGAVAAEPRTVKLLSWNLEHFVDPFDSPYIDNDNDNTPLVKSDATLQKLALAIKTIDADVMAFQEVESDTALLLFLNSYLPDHGYKYTACVPSKEWHQNVAILSRLPMGQVISLREFEQTNPVSNETMSRFNARLLAAEIIVSPQYSFTVMTAHLKAGTDAKDPAWRVLQAEAVHQFIDRESRGFPDLNFALLGDMNTTPTDPEYDAILGKKTATALVDPFAEFNYPATHPARAPRRHIDSIFLNKGMVRELVPESAAVARPLPQAEMAAIADHLPIVASFVVEDR